MWIFYDFCGGVETVYKADVRDPPEPTAIKGKCSDSLMKFWNPLISIFTTKS